MPMRPGLRLPEKTAMALKIGSWLVGVGCSVVFAGLCFLPAAFGSHPDSALLSAGAMLFSLGMVLVASGTYVKARHWADLGSAMAGSDIKRGRRLCDLCGKQKSAIQCRVHQLQLCANCLEEHYDFRSCAYTPSVRQVNAKTRVRSQSSGA
jgi:hypothetical protein